MDQTAKVVAKCADRQAAGHRRKESAMRGKLTFVAGAAIGFVLGTRAGRERYEDIKNATRKLLDSPTVHEATGVVQSQASKLYAQGKETLASSNVTDRLRHPLGSRKDEDTDPFDDHHPQHMSANSF
jgi:hypothetical protein